MLESLHVKNLALIDESEVTFCRGLNILSGETGAGKSIIIGSINLALGGKVQKEMLRENTAGGQEPAFAELVFSVNDSRQTAALAELEVYPEDDLVVLSRRIVNGRGMVKVNGESVPASKVKEIAAVLIDIHGQHEHQSLLSKKKHLEILDDYAREELEGPKKHLAEAYRNYRMILEELKKEDVDEEERLREVSFLEYEVKEIEEAALRLGEDEELEADFRRFSNGHKIMEAAGSAYNSTGGGNDCASDLTGRALRELTAVASYDEKLAEAIMWTLPQMQVANSRLQAKLQIGNNRANRLLGRMEEWGLIHKLHGNLGWETIPKCFEDISITVIDYLNESGVTEAEIRSIFRRDSDAQVNDKFRQ